MIKLEIINGKPHIYQYPYVIPIYQRVKYTLCNIIPHRKEYLDRGMEKIDYFKKESKKYLTK